MGRTLDSLNPLKPLNGQHGKTDKAEASPAAASAVLPATEPAMEVSAAPLAEDLPFIEVGGPGRQIEGSPAVLAALPASAKSAPRSPTKSQPALVPTLSEPRPLAVSFESFPAKGVARVGRDIIAYHEPNHAVSKQYGELFAKMMDGAEDSGRVILCLGAAPQAGATTVLLNLAFSGAGRFRVAALDAHRTRPALALRLGLGPIPGLSEVLSGSAALEKAVATVARLHVLTAGTKAAKPLAPHALSWVLGWLRERYDAILVDGGALAQPEGLETLAAAADAVYLVLPRGDADTTHSHTQTVARLGGRLCGFIHTHFENS